MSFSLRTPIACLVTMLLAAAGTGQVPGGYSKASTTDQGVVEAAKFAVETQSKKEALTLVKIVSAQSQVVAGRNVRMILEVRTKDGLRQAEAVVWNKLDKSQELTMWEWKGEAKPEKKGDDVPLDGGYSTVLTTGKNVEAAASFAIEVHSKKEPVTLVKIEKAESQVVAGKNLRMILEVRTKDGLRQAEAVVWSKLDGSKELTRWEWKTEARPKKKGKP